MTTNAGTTVNRQLLSDQIYTSIREQIISGELAEGDPVVELDISRTLGVSQAPVREAVKRLVHEGLLVHVPRRGSYVAAAQPQDADAARRIRGVVEELAARALTEKPSPEILAELERQIEQMVDAADKNDIGAFRDADVAFHRAVCLHGDSGFLQAIWRLIEPNLRSWRVLSDPLYSGDWRKIADLHRSLLSAIRSGDSDAAGSLFYAHAEGTQVS